MSAIPDISFEYLIGAVMIKGKPNTYFGSVSLKECPGLLDDAFRYRLTVLTPEGAEMQVSASFWVGWQAFDVVDKDKVSEKFFSPNEDGAAQAVAWLRGELEKITADNA